MTEGDLHRTSIRCLWIDCLDNQASPYQILGMASEEVLVYRTLAHQLHVVDLNGLAALEYAVDRLRVREIVICGHHDCESLAAEDRTAGHASIDLWLHPVREVRRRNEARLSIFPDAHFRQIKLCEVNVIEQVRQLCNSPVIREAWRRGQPLAVRGWVYAPDQEMVYDLAIDIASENEIMPAYQRALAACFTGSAR